MRLLSSYDSDSMKPAIQLLCAMMLCGLLCASLQAQAAVYSIPQHDPTVPLGPVPISEEPHHRLLLQNDFTRVYNVMVPPLDTTLLHQHDLPYLYITLGPADIINAIVGKPELHQILQDGETHYSPGHFAHVAQTDSGMPFHNVTIELVRPQGTPKNLCKDVLPGAPADCPEKPPTNNNSKAKKSQPDRAGDDEVPYFETDEIRVDLHKVSSGDDYVDATSKTDALLVALSDSNLDANLGGEHVSFLHGGDVLWLPAGKHRRIVDFLGTRSSFLLISFKDSAPAQQISKVPATAAASTAANVRRASHLL
jgi:hypothetical protein